MATYYWDGSNGNWSDATNWVTLVDGEDVNGVPGPGDTADVNSSVGITVASAITAAEVLLGFNLGGTSFSAPDIIFDVSFTYNGIFETFGNTAINLNDQTFTLSGVSNYLDCVVSGQGTLKITGSTYVAPSSASFEFGSVNVAVDDGAILEDAGAVTQDGSLDLSALGGSGTTGELLIDAGATYEITNVENYASIGGGTFVNNGTLTIDPGALLYLAGAYGVDTLYGSIGGAGTLGIEGNVTIATSKVTVGAIEVVGDLGTGVLQLADNLTYAGTFTEETGATLNLYGGALTLTASSGDVLTGLLEGAYVLETKGATTVANLTIGGNVGTTEWEDAGIATQVGGDVTIGDSTGDTAELYITSLGTYDIADDSGIGIGTSKSSYISNSGLFEKTGGTASSTISAEIINSGTIEAASGTLDITGEVTGSGKLVINGGVLSLGSSASGGTITFGTSTGTLDVDDGADVATITNFGLDDVIELNSFKASYEAVFYATAGGGTLAVIDTADDNAVVAELTFSGSFTGEAFTLVEGPNNDTEIGLANAPWSNPQSGEVLVTNVVGSGYSAYQYDYALGGQFIGAQYYYTNITGETYTTEEVDYNGGGQLTRAAFTGITGQAYSSFEYDYVGGVYEGAKFAFTTAPVGATYLSYEIDYNYNNQFTGDKFFFTDVPGQSYSEEEDFDANASLTRVLITGATGQAFSSLEVDYSSGNYEGYKAYYDVSGQSFTNEEVDVSATNQLEKIIYSGMSSTPYSSVEEDYSAGAPTGEIYSFTDVPNNVSYYSYQVDEDATGVAQQEIIDNTNGTHSIIGLGAAGQTFDSIGNDIFTGGGANETFVFNPIHGADTITDFYQFASGATHDTISLPTSEFASFAAVLSNTQNVSGNAVITAQNGDTITLDNTTTSMLSAASGDFIFHA